jgi:HrpA-like RNA helicase
MQIHDFENIDWLDTPPVAALQNAESLLDRLGASGKMIDRLAPYPLPPRLSRILVEAMESGVAEDGCVAAALLGSGTGNEKDDLLDSMESRPARAEPTGCADNDRPRRILGETLSTGASGTDAPIPNAKPRI